VPLLGCCDNRPQRSARNSEEADSYEAHKCDKAEDVGARHGDFSQNLKNGTQVQIPGILYNFLSPMSNAPGRIRPRTNFNLVSLKFFSALFTRPILLDGCPRSLSNPTNPCAHVVTNQTCSSVSLFATPTRGFAIAKQRSVSHTSRKPPAGEAFLSCVRRVGFEPTKPQGRLVYSQV
jgi:hypothetical protein